MAFLEAQYFGLSSYQHISFLFVCMLHNTSVMWFVFLQILWKVRNIIWSISLQIRFHYIIVVHRHCHYCYTLLLSAASVHSCHGTPYRCNITLSSMCYVAWMAVFRSTPPPSSQLLRVYLINVVSVSIHTYVHSSTKSISTKFGM